MTRFARPMRGADLLAAPEMLLRHPAEWSAYDSSYDEGVGAWCRPDEP